MPSWPINIIQKKQLVDKTTHFLMMRGLYLQAHSFSSRSSLIPNTKQTPSPIGYINRIGSFDIQTYPSSRSYNATNNT